ncbi:MAG: aspartate/glutamate racemase family protein, partial [Clostridiales bacterium]|nr:aspartate/glutamate racemase family protein [Clostridiales bacterium]
NGKSGWIAPQATISTGAYERVIRALAPQTEIYAAACPLFVPLVENGRTQPGDVVIETVARDYLTPLKEAGVDVLVLGCTHYPLIREVIGAFMGPQVQLVDSGAEAAHEVGWWLSEHDSLASADHAGRCRWYVSDAQGFRELASRFLGRPVTEPVERVDIEQY